MVRALAVMFLGRLGSLHALAQTRRQPFWPRWLGADWPSADTLGRGATPLEGRDLRAGQRPIDTRLKRGKALPPQYDGLLAGGIDKHESHATFRRHCPGCLRRTIHTAAGERVQYYHRLVTQQLVGADRTLLLDVEPQRPGEDEVAAALRLLERGQAPATGLRNRWSHAARLVAGAAGRYLFAVWGDGPRAFGRAAAGGRR